MRGLGISLGKRGFCQDEADHQGVCVQPPPSGSAVAESYAQYNQRRCAGQPYLERCFGADSTVTFGLLAHNHLLLVLLSWLRGAQWDLDAREREVMVVDAEGRLDLQAASKADNLIELAKTCGPMKLHCAPPN